MSYSVNSNNTAKRLRLSKPLDSPVDRLRRANNGDDQKVKKVVVYNIMTSQSNEILKISADQICWNDYHIIEHFEAYIEQPAHIQDTGLAGTDLKMIDEFVMEENYDQHLDVVETKPVITALGDFATWVLDDVQSNVILIGYQEHHEMLLTHFYKTHPNEEILKSFRELVRTIDIDKLCKVLGYHYLKATMDTFMLVSIYDKNSNKICGAIEVILNVNNIGLESLKKYSKAFNLLFKRRYNELLKADLVTKEAASKLPEIALKDYLKLTIEGTKQWFTNNGLTAASAAAAIRRRNDHPEYIFPEYLDEIMSCEFTDSCDI